MLTSRQNNLQHFKQAKRDASISRRNFLHSAAITSCGLLLTEKLAMAQARIILPSVIASHMVLQCNKPVPIWGRADAGEKVTVAFAGQTRTATADADGKWMVKLNPMSASTESRTMTISGHDSKITLSDVLVGEVWLCSGQSNMEMPVGDIERGPYLGVVNWQRVIALPANPELRLFRDDKQRAWNARGWRQCDGKDVRVFSAMAYFFGKALQKKLGVPVGLVEVSRGGSFIQSWTPQSYALRNPVTRYYANLYWQHRDRINAFNKATRQWALAREAGHQDVVRPAPLPDELVVPGYFAKVASLYDNFVKPLAPFAVRGVIWYQGESNGHLLETAEFYDTMLRDLIEGWRARWGQSDMPWFLAQLPCWDFPNETYWPWVRQGQLIASRSLPDVNLEVTCDLGDPSNLHPPKKQEFGDRMATLVLARTYGRHLICAGPTIESVHRFGAKLRIKFATGGSPILIKGGTWQNIEMAGENGIFHPATASITDSVATVSSDAVSLPCAFRYGWTNAFRPTLFNEAGLPASPFGITVKSDNTYCLTRAEPSFRKSQAAASK